MLNSCSSFCDTLNVYIAILLIVCGFRIDRPLKSKVESVHRHVCIVFCIICIFKYVYVFLN